MKRARLQWFERLTEEFGPSRQQQICPWLGSSEVLDYDSHNGNLTHYKQHSQDITGERILNGMCHKGCSLLKLC